MSDQNITTEATEDGEHYIVRLLWSVPASSHEDAVKKAVDQLARFGIIDWVYRSESPNDDVLYLNGDLEVVDLQRAVEQLPDDDERPIEDVELPSEEE
jgi:hypothetical protein